MKATVGTRDYKPKDLLTVHEVAPILRVAQKTVYRYLDEGTLPSVRFGGAVRVEYGVLMAFISGKQPEQETNHATGTNNPAETPLGHNAPETLAYKVEEAAAALHVKPVSITNAVENGQLYAIRVGTETVIPKGELEQMVEAPARVDQFTRQLLIQKGMVSEGFPFDNPESYKKNEKEIRAIVGYVASRVAEIRSGYNFGLHTGLDEILKHVGTEVMEGKYASQQAAPRRGKK